MHMINDAATVLKLGPFTALKEYLNVLLEHFIFFNFHLDGDAGLNQCIFG